MNIFFRKGTSSINATDSNKDDQLVLQSNQITKDDDDDDKLILTSTNDDKQKKTETLLTQTVHQLFGKTSASTSNSIDEKNILNQNTTDEQLIDLN